MRLTKKIPERTKTVFFDWVKRDFIVMSDGYRRIRPERKPMDKCWWCGHPFVDGETMALGAVTGKGKGNKVLCAACADEAIDDYDAQPNDEVMDIAHRADERLD